MSVLDLKCSFFQSIFEEHNSHRPIGEILTGIQCGDWSDTVESIRSGEMDKKSLPSAYFSGTFSGRELKTMQEYNGILVLDIDNDPRKPSIVREALMRDNHVISAFISPSGNGVKALIKMNTKSSEHSTLGFSYAEYYFRKFYKIEIDKATKNINRHCFMSFDEDLQINEDAELFRIPVFWEMPQKSSGKYTDNGMDIQRNSKIIFDQIVKWKNNDGRFVKGNRNNFIFGLICECNRYGIHKDEAYRLIRSRYPSFDEGELMASLSHYERTPHEFGSRQMKSRVRRSNQGSIFD